MPRKFNTAVVTIGIDPGKNTLHLVGLDARGEIVLREKVARTKIVSRLANVPPCLIGIEAGMGTHYVTRELLALDHDVRQVPPVYAKPFRQAHKNDFRDAHAVAEAVAFINYVAAEEGHSRSLPGRPRTARAHARQAACSGRNRRRCACYSRWLEFGRERRWPAPNPRRRRARA